MTKDSQTGDYIFISMNGTANRMVTWAELEKLGLSSTYQRIRKLEQDANAPELVAQKNYIREVLRAVEFREAKREQYRNTTGWEKDELAEITKEIKLLALGAKTEQKKIEKYDLETVREVLICQLFAWISQRKDYGPLVAKTLAALASRGEVVPSGKELKTFSAGGIYDLAAALAERLTSGAETIKDQEDLEEMITETARCFVVAEWKKTPLQQDLATIITIMEKRNRDNKEEIIDLAQSISADIDLLVQTPPQFAHFFASRTNPVYGKFIEQLRTRLKNLRWELGSFNWQHGRVSATDRVKANLDQFENWLGNERYWNIRYEKN